MTTSCATGCPMPAADVEEGGINLGLCLDHLTALRRMCKGKQRYPYAKLAAREATRISDQGASHRPGRQPAPYRCPLCRSDWHVGHRENLGDGQPVLAMQALDAVRDQLSAEQLNHLCNSWRPGNARRPARRRTRTGQRL